MFPQVNPLTLGELFYVLNLHTYPLKKNPLLPHRILGKRKEVICLTEISMTQILRWKEDVKEVTLWNIQYL